MKINYEDLAGAIILQTVKDYRKALRILRSDPEDSVAIDTRDSIEQFFRSEYFVILSDLNPECLIKRLIKEVIA